MRSRSISSARCSLTGGWTMLTAVNLMLFSLLPDPCATTIITIYKETLSAKWADRRADAAGHRLCRHLTASFARLFLGY
ncbi:MAG: hypothetical protein R2712_15460 [Vicinamibacterales bacterium]